MASGAKDRIYETDSGASAKLRLAKADFDVAGNIVGAGDPEGMRIYNRRSSRKLGIQPRRLVLSKLLRAGVPDDGIPDQFSYRYVTILTPVAFAGFAVDDEIEYDGGNWTIDRKQDESTNG